MSARAANRLALALLAAVGFALTSATAHAGSIVGCGPTGANCAWEVYVDGQLELYGTYDVNLETGQISLPAPVFQDLSGGRSFSVTSLNGNADPIMGFGLGAATGASGSTFVFNLNLPIAISGTIDASSSVSYSLTSLSAAGAQISPFLGPAVVIGNEVDTSIGGLGSLNKGVDVGPTFFFTGGPQTQNSPVYTATNSFTGDLAYDLMTVSIAFSLSANSSVGVSGFVQQVENAPEPAMLGLLAIVGVGLALRRRSA